MFFLVAGRAQGFEVSWAVAAAFADGFFVVDVPPGLVTPPAFESVSDSDLMGDELPPPIMVVADARLECPGQAVGRP